MSKSINKYINLIPYAIALIIFIGLSIPNSSMSSDDYCYTYYWDEGVNIMKFKEDGYRQLMDISEILPSQINHYYSNNSRFVVHVLTQLFAKFLGYKALTIIKIIFSLLVYILLCRISSPIKENHLVNSSVVLILFLLILPYYSIGSFFGNAALTFNYMLPTLGMLSVLYWLILFKDKEAHNVVKIFLIISCMICGSLHEGFSLAILAALFIYLYKHRKTLNQTSLIIIISFFIGTLTLLGSPGSYVRLSEHIPSLNLIEFISTQLQGWFRLYIAFVPILIIMILLFFYRQTINTVTYLKSNLIYILIILFNIIICCIANPHYIQNTRCLMPVAFMLIILFAKFIFKTTLYKKKILVSSISLTLSLVLGFYYTVNGMERKNIRDERLSQYMSNVDGIIHINDIENYVPAIIPFGFDIEGEYSPYYGTLGFNKKSTEYYFSHGKKEINFMPYIDDSTFIKNNLIWEKDSIKIYTKKDSWWILIKGLKSSKYTPKAVKYNYTYSHWPTELLFNVFHKYPVPLYNLKFEYKEDSILLISKYNHLNIKKIELDSEIVFVLK